MLATVSRKKAWVVEKAGADYIIPYHEEDFSSAANKIMGDKKIDIIYDSVGSKTFQKNFACIRKKGLIVSFGQSSGVISPFNLLELAKAGSILITRPQLSDYIADYPSLETRSLDLFRYFKLDRFFINIDTIFPLKKAAFAHDLLEHQKVVGKILLDPKLD